MDKDLLLKLLAEKGVDLSPDMLLRGMPGPMQREPMIPNGPVGNPFLAQEAEAPAAPPKRSFMDKLRSGVQVPTTPIRHRNTGSRSFLRGLVGGFKASGDSPEGGDRGSRSGAAVGPDGLTAAQRIGFEYRDRADKRANESSERQARALESLLADRERRFTTGREDEAFDRANTEADNRRADTALAASLERLRMAKEAAARIGKMGSRSSDPTAARKAYWDAQADVLEAQINAKYEKDTAALRPSSMAKRKATAERDAAIQQVKAWRSRQNQTISAQQIEGKGLPNPESTYDPSAIDEDDFDVPVTQ